MKVSREQMAENRRRILEVASRLFKDKGFESVSVAEIMKAAGQTHGGFYGHFSSKDDLVAKTLAHALADDSTEEHEFSAYLKSYLAPRHRDNPQKGCPTASFAAPVRHQASEARLVMTEGVRSQLEKIEKALPDSLPDRRSAAIGSWSAMVGAIVLARAIEDPELSDEILKQTQTWIETSVG